MKTRKRLYIALLMLLSICTLFACQPGQPLSPRPLPVLSALRPTRATDSTPLVSFATTAPSTEQLLAQTQVPASDMRDLAIRLRPDVDAVPLVVNSTPPDYTVSDRISFWVLNVSTQETRQITAELIHKTAVAYAWVEVGPAYNRDLIIAAVEQFSSQSYPATVAFFGHEWNPGVDNDPRLHILHTTGIGAASGYFGSADEYSRLVNPYSNEKEMFYVSLEAAGDGDLLAHEFQHMIHWYHDANEATWVDEGLSEYAKEVAGFAATTDAVIAFLHQPDMSLTAWGDGTPNHYGAAYLFMKYLHQRFGPMLLRTVVAQAANGVAGFQHALAQRNITQTFDTLFADWVVANYANQPNALGMIGVYGYPAFPFRKPSTALLNDSDLIKPYQASVNNYGTDYIRLQGEEAVTVQFSGQISTQLAATPAYSGRYTWWSNQGDRSDSRLTRWFDLSKVVPNTPITLEVAMWWDIEAHYDYGYVLASRDGRKWDILSGPHTTTDNPTGRSFGPAYTSENPVLDRAAGRWVQEQFDLSVYAGQAIWVRFEYITDDAKTNTGWFIDDVRIPALRYATDFEHGTDGWKSEGWLLTDNHLTQRWLLQVMTFDGDTLVKLQRIEVDATGRAHIEIPNLNHRQYAVLAISALAPATTIPGQYELEIRRINAKNGGNQR